METSERKYDMHRKKVENVLVSVYDANEKDKKEYETFIDKYEYTIDNKEEVIDDLDNQHYSEGEDYD
tara:strand:+ start:81 stop:281 length:201 start_codon:yes stop_codon:yes gene_type:complete